MSIQDGMSISASTTLSSAVVGFIHGEGLPFALVESYLFARVIAAAKNAPASYKLPGKDEIGGVYLDKNVAIFISKDDELVLLLGSRFGYSMLSDGAAAARAAS